MKRLTLSLMILLLALSLSACGKTYSKGGSTLKVKCPSCGYEFETERVDP